MLSRISSPTVFLPADVPLDILIQTYLRKTMPKAEEKTMHPVLPKQQGGIKQVRTAEGRFSEE